MSQTRPLVSDAASSPVIDYLPKDPDVITAVARFLWDGFGKYHADTSVEQYRCQLLERAGGKTIPLTLVCYLKKIPIGTASIYEVGMRGNVKSELSPWMSVVYVQPDFREIGIGTKLCMAIIEELRRLQISKAYLHTSNKEDYYRKLGWETIDRLAYGGNTEAIMEYKL